jgi:large subunit ribosomal protein L25
LSITSPKEKYLVSSHELKVASRSLTGKSAAKSLRRAGRVPAVVYGHKEEPALLSVDAHELGRLLTHGGAHSLLVLKEEGQSDVTAVIKSLHRHPYKPSVNTIDFLRVSRDEEITATVPIVLDGEPSDMRANDGVLVQSLHEIQIKAKPADIPEAIHVDVSGLVFNGAPIHVNEITLPTGVTAVTSGDEPVAVVNPGTVEAEEPSSVSDETDAAEVPAEHGAGGPLAENETGSHA